MKFKKFLSTLSACGFCGYFAYMPQGGFVVIFFVLYFIPAFFVYLIKLVKNPLQRAYYSQIISLWFITLTVSFVMIDYKHSRAVQIADNVVQKILQHKKQNHVYPQSLSEVGLNPSELEKAKHMGIYYRYVEKQPILFRKNPNIPFQTASYDFVSQQWQAFRD